MSSLVHLALIWLMCIMSKLTQASDAQHAARQLDPISGGDVLRRHIGDGSAHHEVDFPATEVLHSLMMARMLDNIGGGHLLRALDNTLSGRNPEESSLINEELLNHLNDYRGSDALAIADRMTDGALMKALDKIEGTELLLALDRARKESGRMTQKRTLDTLSGMAFGESKRMRPFGSSSLAKRNFDEIDNVGFNGWQKRSSFYGPESEKRYGGRYQTLALARRGYGGMSSLAKKNFDEIDRTGFEGFSKRETKRSL